MSPDALRPDRPLAYHITHSDNLSAIITTGGLLSDAQMSAAGGPSAAIGMNTIKQRRMSLPVKGLQGVMVGECVPFFFCPRSIMLYVLHMGNHPELAYRAGQAPIVHLEFDVLELIEWAEHAGVGWAISLSNAAAYYAEFRRTTDALDELNWSAITATDFRDPTIKDAKQAELLIEGKVPWNLVRRIGVMNQLAYGRVVRLLPSAGHRPLVEIIPAWYY